MKTRKIRIVYIYSTVIISVSYPSIQSTASLLRKIYGVMLYCHIIRVKRFSKKYGQSISSQYYL